MSDRVEIKITASNGATQVFRAVASDATKMGDAVDQAGKKGGRSFDDWSKAAQKTGAAIGALGAVSIKLAGDAEAAEARLSTAFTNAGLSVDEYGDRIKALTDEGLELAFDDEDVTDALARIISVTGDYASAVEGVGLAEDIARARQISLADATNIVAGAEAGRFRTLQQMGVVLDETATKEDYLAAATERFSGSAEAFAETGAADFQRWQNTAENALEAVGAHFVDLQGPILAASAGITAFGTVASSLKSLEVGAKLTSLALGPAGMVAAAGLAVGGLVLLGKSLQDTNLDANEAATQIEDFNALISELGSSGASVDLTTTLAGFSEGLQTLASGSTYATSQLGFLYDTLDRLRTVVEQNRAAPDYLQEDTTAIEEQISVVERQIAAMEAAEVSGQDFADAQAAIADIVQRTAQINYPILIDRLEELDAQLKNGEITGDEYVAQLIWLQKNAAAYGVTLEELAAQQSAATVTMTEFTRAMEAQGAALTAQTDDMEEFIGQRQAHADAQVRMANDIAQSMQVQGAASVELLRIQEEQSVALIASTVAGDHATITIDQIAAAMEGGTQAAILNTEAIQKYAEAIGQMPAGETFGARLAGRAAAAGSALGDAFRTGVGNVGDLGGQSAQVAKWADELGNVEDGYSEINQLFDEGRLTADEYNAAIAAGNRIQSENAEIQRNVLDIQATQLPIIAELTAEQQRYLEHIAQQPPALQAVALAYMDTETSAKALELAQLAAAAAAGELGVAGEGTAQKMIEGAAQADPYLKALLEDMGLISVGADGTITVNFGSVEDAGASLDTINDSLTLLTELLATAFGITIVDGEVVSADEHVDELSRSMGNLDGTQAEISLDGNALYADTYAGGVWNLRNQIEALDGAHATTTITHVETTVRNIVNQGGGLIPIAGLHGGVLGYADGGIVARMAEAGPELLHFANGGMGMAMSDGLYNVPRGTYVTPAPASKQALGGGLGMTVQFHAPVTIVANDPAQFERQLRGYAVTGARQ